MKKKITVKINGKKEIFKISRICSSRLVSEDKGIKKWVTYNFPGKNKIVSFVDQKGNVIERHIYNKKGKELIDDNDDSRLCNAQIEKQYDEKGKLIHVINKETGFETWFDYDKNGFLVHTKNSAGYEHYNTLNSQGEISDFRIEKDGKIITASKEFISDCGRFKLRKTECLDRNETQVFIHEYFFKSGKVIKENLYS